MDFVPHDWIDGDPVEGLLDDTQLDRIEAGIVEGITKAEAAVQDADLAAAQSVGINGQTGTEYTMVLTDVGKIVRRNNAAANTVTFEAGIFANGDSGMIVQYGDGQTTIVADTGVTPRSADGALKTRVKYSTVSWIVVGTDTILFSGDLVV